MKELIPPILKALEVFEPKMIYLFGSTTEDRSRPDSDLDLAFYPGKPIHDRPLLFAKAQELAAILKKEVDLIDLSQSSTVMQKEIVSKGILLSEADERFREEFEMQVHSNYARLNEERRPVLKALGYV